MAPSRVHVLVNCSCFLFLIVVSVGGVWWLVPFGWLGKLIISTLFVILLAYGCQYLLPKVTVPMVDWWFSRIR